MNREDHGLSKRLVIEGRRIALQHERIGELFEQFASAIAEQRMDQMRLTFRELREGLIAHFDLEERIQIPALHGADAGLQPALARIVADHDRFRDELAALAHDVEAGAFEALRGPAATLSEGITEHEAFEEMLFPGARKR
jgi:benzoyl-CoA reductase/2-hydroxyglutaryl-CoA dehydratase subunit BcrC/BadD/HgdB